MLGALRCCPVPGRGQGSRRSLCGRHSGEGAGTSESWPSSARAVLLLWRCLKELFASCWLIPCVPHSRLILASQWISMTKGNYAQTYSQDVFKQMCECSVFGLVWMKYSLDPGTHHLATKYYVGLLRHGHSRPFCAGKRLSIGREALRGASTAQTTPAVWLCADELCVVSSALSQGRAFGTRQTCFSGPHRFCAPSGPACKMEMIRPAAEDWSEDKFTWTNSVTAKHVVNAHW